MNQLERLIDAARDQLPTAFSTTESPPWPEQLDKVYTYEPIPTADVDADIYNPNSPLGVGTAVVPELEELEEELRESGVEALAIYLSFTILCRMVNGGSFCLESQCGACGKRFNESYTHPYLKRINWQKNWLYPMKSIILD